MDSGSPDPRKEDYRGPKPFSELETMAIRDLALQHDFEYAVSFHSGIELIIYPWGYTKAPTPHDHVFKEVAEDLSKLIGVDYGQSSVLLYTASGLWDDWMYGNRSTVALTCEIYWNKEAWEHEPGPKPFTWWRKGVFRYFNQIPNKSKPWLKGGYLFSRTSLTGR